MNEIYNFPDHPEMGTLDDAVRALSFGKATHIQQLVVYQKFKYLSNELASLYIRFGQTMFEHCPEEMSNL